MNVSVVTGGGGGIGLAAARLLGARGDRVVLGEVNRDRLDAAVTALKAEGYDAIGSVCDVTKPDDVTKLADAASAQGDIKVLLHTAGLSPSMGDGRAILTVNYLGTWNVLDAFSPLLGNGSVVICIASMASYRRRAYQYHDLMRDPREPGVLDALVEAARTQSRPAYSISKRGVVRLCEQRAAELASKGARILSISPGIVDTEMGRLEVSAGGRGNMQVALQTTPLGRLATAEEIAGMAVLLCDPVASYVTGCDVLVDGGTIAGYEHHAAPEVATAFNDPWE